MKVYLNRKPKTGPWGGGNRFLTSFVKELNDRGYEIVYNLEPNIDILFCMDPRPNNSGIGYYQILDYKNYYNAKLIQRVGDVGTHGKPQLTKLLRDTIKCSDTTIFPSQWAYDYLGVELKNMNIIQNAPIDRFYNVTEQSKNEKFTLVTHHWSNNLLKGFDIYEELDLCIPELDCDMLYVGRVPAGYKFKNIKHIPPIDIEGIISYLQKSHVYITASRLEAGANHVLEAMALNLPIIYHKDGGSIPEYCKGFGFEYHDILSLKDNIKHVRYNYDLYISYVKKYNETMETNVKKYVNILEGVL